MAIFNGHTVTNDGRNLLGRALSGAGKIIFTKAAFGQGTYTGDLREIKELVDKRLDCVVSDILNDRGTVNIKIQVTNENLTQAFRTEEFGIFAKIEGDATEILYYYAAAQESDAIPNNSFGDTFMAEHTVYLAFSSDAEADIYIKEGAVFLTRDTADKSYVIIDLEAKGDLSSGRTSLEADKIYKADDGKWYKNIGGDRSWMSGNGVPDELLKLISWEQIYKDISENTNLILGNTGSEGIEFIQDNGTKIIGRIYFDKDVTPYTPYYCISTNEDVTVTSNFVTASNKELARKTRKFSVTVLYNGGAALVNGATSGAISFGTYQFLAVRVRRGQVDLHSNIIYQYMPGRLYLEGGGILLINSNGTITVENNGVSGTYTGIMEVQGMSFGTWT